MSFSENIRASKTLPAAVMALAALLLCGAISLAVPASAQAKDYMFSDGPMNYVIVDGVSKGKVSYNASTNTLTLKNVTAKGNSGMGTIRSGGVYKLNIKLVGKNKLKPAHSNAMGTIAVNELTISGKGKLYVTAPKYNTGIRCDMYSNTNLKYGALKVKKGASVTVSGGNPGIRCKKCLVSGATLQVKNANTAIDVQTWNDAQKATSKTGGGKFNVTSGKVVITKAKDYAVLCNSATFKKRAKVSVSGQDAELTSGIVCTKAAYKRSGKNVSFGGWAKNYGTVTGRNVSSVFRADGKVTNRKTLDCSGCYYGLNCNYLYNTVNGVVIGNDNVGGAVLVESLNNRGVIYAKNTELAFTGAAKIIAEGKIVK